MWEDFFHARDLFRRALHHDPATAVAALGAQVDEPVGLGDDIQIVFDDHHGVAGSTRRCSTRISFSTSAMCRPDRRLVQHVEGGAGFRGWFGIRCGLLVGSRLGQFGDQLDALRLAAAQRRARLAEGEIAQSDVLQQLQCVVDGRDGRGRTPPPRRTFMASTSPMLRVP